MKRALIKKADIAVILIFLASAALLFLPFGLKTKAGHMADIYIDGKYSTSLPLDKNTVYIPEGRNVKIEVRDGKIGFTQSDCPDKICINTGFISAAGQSAVCLPNGISVRVRGKDEVDTVS